MRVNGIGPEPCEVMFVAEGPGFEEGRKGYPLVGKTGSEFNRLMNGIDLPDRSSIFVTNLFREYKGKDYQWADEDMQDGSAALMDELRRVKPRIVIAMGRHATRWFLGDVDMDDVHGLPWIIPKDRSVVFRLDGWDHGGQPIVFPVYHIAAGFHNPEIGGYVSYDFQQLAAFFGDRITPRILYDDPYGEGLYEEITEPKQIAIHSALHIAIDTEGSARSPWSIQYSQSPGSGRIIRASNGRCVEEFGKQLRAKRPTIVFHNSLYDMAVLRSMGIETNDLPFDDTMVAAYLLQVEPKGLKPLCVRHCNMKMDSYEDILGDAQNRLAYDYFSALWDIEQTDYMGRQQEEFERINTTRLLDRSGSPKRDKSGNFKYRRTRVLPTLPKSALHKAVERGLRSKAPFKLWSNWADDQPAVRDTAYRRLGDMPEATLDHVPLERALNYGGRDADGTGRLEPELSSRVQELGLGDVYALELGTYPLIDRMQAVGITPDLQHFTRLSRDLGSEIDQLQIQLETQSGIEGFNANSGDQVADYIFDRLGLEGFKRTESGRFSTNDKVLEALEHEHPEHPIISTIRDYREVYKLKNTFVDRIPDFVYRYPHDGRVHPTFRTTRVVTGRLAASDPNLLAQPKHGKFAKKFRRGWIAGEGHVLGEWDLSQIELRILAHLSQDPVMLAIFRGEKRNPDGSLIDLHAALAERIFGVKPKDQNKSKHRLPAKAINFGLPMGMTYKGLTVELRKNGVMVDEDDAQRWIDETMALYKAVPAYQQGMMAEARRNGYIRCLSGRIRYIGGIKSRDEAIRSEAERFAFSTPIQEGAQWLMKKAEKRIWDEIIVPAGRTGRYVQPLLQVHDAITLEFDPAMKKDLNTHMCQIMTATPSNFTLPVETSGDWGLNMCAYDPDDPESIAGVDMVAFT